MTHHVRIKICGITRFEDARVAIDLGVEAIGLVFAPTSKRRIEPEVARDISDRIHPFVAVIGVFKDANASDIQRVTAIAGLKRVELHGESSQALIDALEVPVIRAVSVSSRSDVERANATRCQAILFDGPEPGSGKRFATAALQGHPLPPCFGVAGGLDADNVAEVVAEVRPHWVDVSSGVESSPGIKDPKLIERFVRAVHGASR